MITTESVIVAYVVAGVALDAWAYLRLGGGRTASTALTRASMKYPIIAFALGTLAGHWFWPYTP